MGYNVGLNTVYNHYLTTYAPKPASRYDAHKKSELRNIYNSIVKLNKESPLCIVDSSKDTQQFAVGIKENARELRNTIASLGGLSENEILNKKTAYSTSEDIASATFIGELPDSVMVAPFNIEVTALASNQINMGQFLPSSAEIGMSPDAYSFDITINDISYEFQYNIREGDSNRTVQERLSRLVNNADIGIRSDIIEDEGGNASLRFTSDKAGNDDQNNLIFNVSDDRTSKKSGTVDYLGLSYIAREPSNAVFTLNDETRTSSSNHFTVDKMFELTLNGISSMSGDTAEIGLKTDTDSLTENISNLIGGHNSFMKAASGYLDAHPKSGRLIHEMEHITELYKTDLENMGFVFESDGQISLNENILKDTALDNNGTYNLSTIKDFANSILQKTNHIALNPMQYADKTIVAYKNPGRNFASPYVTSAYSGMMFNSYC